MARIKKIYDPGDLVETVQSVNAAKGSIDQIKPGFAALFYELQFPRKTRLFVIRHESGANERFRGSVLCISHFGIAWVDSRRVALVVDKNGAT